MQGVEEAERKVEAEGRPAARRLVLCMADLTQRRADQRDFSFWRDGTFVCFVH